MARKKKFIIALTVVFISGIIIGSLAGFSAASFFQPPRPGGPPPSPEKMNKQLCERLSEDLKLSQQQQADLEKKLPQALSSLFSKHMKMRDEFKTTLESVVKSLTPPLDEKQLKLFEEHKKRHDERFRKDGGPPPPPPDEKI